MVIGALNPTVIGALTGRNYFDEAFFLLADLTFVALLVSPRVTGDY